MIRSAPASLASAFPVTVAQRDALWRFVSDYNVEPTNNHAERELRGLLASVQLWLAERTSSRRISSP